MNWTEAEAHKELDRLFDLATTVGPQHIMGERGTVVVVSESEYLRVLDQWRLEHRTLAKSPFERTPQTVIDG